MTLEDIVNRWSSDLDERVREFTNLAQEIREWDAILLGNGEEISKLVEELQALDPISQTINDSLDYIEQEQKSLSGYMDQYEAQVDEMLANRPGLAGAGGSSTLSSALGGGSSSGVSGPSSERDRTYRLAEDLNNQLDDLSRSLTALINEVNSLSASAGLTHPASDPKDAAAQDPVAAIAAILNAHLSSLGWIEKTGNSLTAQVEELEGKLKVASGDRWQGLSSSRSNQGNLANSRTGTPSRGLIRAGTPTSSSRTYNNGFGRSTGTPNGRAATPIQGSSSLARSGIFGLGARR